MWYIFRLQRLVLNVLKCNTQCLTRVQAEVVIYHSALRNNIYKLVPFKVPEGPLCDKINQEYRKYLMNELHAVSDMPFSEDDAENLCAHFVKDVCFFLMDGGRILIAVCLMAYIFLQKSFSVKNYEFENSNVPKFLQAGMYKAYILLKKGGVIMSGLEAVVDLS